MKYQFRPYVKIQPTIVTLTGKVYEKGEHPLYKDFRIIEAVDEEGNIHYAFEDELKSDEVKKQKTTLEESAEIFVNNRFTKQICGSAFYPDIYASKEAIVESHILFAKFQQEISYSEEEVLSMLSEVRKGSMVTSSISNRTKTYDTKDSGSIPQIGQCR